MEKSWLTAQEVADILKIKKTTVYDLVRRGELPSTKVGKQVRVASDALDRYLNQDMPADPPQRQAVSQTLQYEPRAAAPGSMVLSGQDVCLDLLVSRLARHGIPLLRMFNGCYDGLVDLYRGRVTMSVAHMWDRETDLYNLPYIARMLPGVPVGVVRIGGRRQGLYVRKNNPKAITTWADLARGDVTMINRERGCGTRVLLDQKLLSLGLTGGQVRGYDQETTSHLGVASAVAKGMADVGCGCEKSMSAVAAVEFVPQQMEIFDLVFRLEDKTRMEVDILLDYLTSPVFRQDLEVLGDYDLTETGKYMELR